MKKSLSKLVLPPDLQSLSKGAKMRRMLTGVALASMMTLGITGTVHAQVVSSPIPNTNHAELARVGGTVQVGDVVTITVMDTGLPNGQEPVSYTVKTGDTILKIGQGLVAAVKADVNLSAIGISATSRQVPKSGNIAAQTFVTLRSNSPNATTYVESVSTGATETVALSANSNVAENATILGTLTAADTLSITVNDQALPGGSIAVSYVVTSSDSPTTAATNLAALITKTAALKHIGVSATSAANIITLNSVSVNTTGYAETVTGSSETISLSVNPNVAQNIMVSGTPVKGTELILGAIDPAIASGHEAVLYTVPANATLASIAKGIVAKIKADTALSGAGISASAASDQITLVSNSSNATVIATQSYSAAQIKVLGNQCAAFSSGTTWPAPFVYVCETTTDTSSQKSQLSTDANTLLATVTALGNTSASPGGMNAPDAASKLSSSTNQWRLYQNHADYESLVNFSPLGPANGGIPWYCAKNSSVDNSVNQAGVYGYTLPCEGHSISIFFEDDGVTALQNQQGGINHAIAHETGHQIDQLYGDVLNSALPYSRSGAFTTAATGIDIAYLNQIPACAYQATDGNAIGPGGGYWASPDYTDPRYPNNDPLSGGKGGYFTGMQNPNDPQGGFICANGYGPDDKTVVPGGSARLPTGNITSILTTPSIFGLFYQKEVFASTAGSNPNTELFAEEYAVLTGFVDFSLVNNQPFGGSDSFLINQGGFVCSQNYVVSLSMTGQLPALLYPQVYKVPAGVGTNNYGCDGSVVFQHYDFAS